MEKENTKANLASFWKLLKSIKLPKVIMITALTLSLLETGAALIVPLFTKNLVDKAASSALETSVIVILILAFMLQAISGGISSYLIMYVGEIVVSRLRSNLWRKVLFLEVPYFDKHQSGETMSRITQDTNTIKTLVTQHLVSFLTGIVSIVGSVIILLFIDWKMTLVMVLAVPFSLLLIIPLGRKMYRISKATQDELASFSGELGRVLGEIRLVKMYSAENVEVEKGEEGIKKLFRFGLKEARIQSVLHPFMTLIMMLVIVVLIGYGGVRVASGTLTAGSLVAIIIYMFQIIVPFSQMATSFSALQKALGATERIGEMLNLRTEEKQKGKNLEEALEDIELKDISFSYNNETPILKDINLRIPKGKTTAFVGPSGGGKTTLFSLLERFYKPTSGRITIGEENIDSFTLSSWRKAISYVSQESPIMSGTIRENICYGVGREVSDEEVKKAAKLANAKEFIDNLSDGFHTEVGERGIKLSGGQRQRIAIARALIRDPKILFLDEATSSLDSSSEHLVQQALNRLMKGRTTLIIAHRLSTVVHADQLVVIEKGEISGVGTHENLLKNHNLYQKLVQQQQTER
ncbi:ABC transporter ATP-binding protein [Priestia filamentosa]|uniref:Multidrug ABC transporter permease n=1 Tax=Priestia filamentosa TaxID=1402861 RepID=A0A1X7DFB7_9BACI|nr:ABC transporter ATP-binding protein [Priestia filamentosa]AKO93497.1 multidrug ABC transporter permease [Priestia filamentosa]MDT3763689.1 ABC transporter ATP-binding protein [Priestia filamentosa]OXS71815.1 multidrug ABC transporter permease [Priestia filamentosa]RJS63197.1 ABC transporter ATP-binding protein [Priestia filamentosa]WCM14338.1 ABC transporter ATP-binding protein [Priestia filamentosa]